MGDGDIDGVDVLVAFNCKIDGKGLLLNEEERVDVTLGVNALLGVSLGVEREDGVCEGVDGEDGVCVGVG